MVVGIVSCRYQIHTLEISKPRWRKGKWEAVIQESIDANKIRNYSYLLCNETGKISNMRFIILEFHTWGWSPKYCSKDRPGSHQSCKISHRQGFRLQGNQVQHSSSFPTPSRPSSKPHPTEDMIIIYCVSPPTPTTTTAFQLCRAPSTTWYDYLVVWWKRRTIITAPPHHKAACTELATTIIVEQ